jgi:hypothetical protein
MVLRGAAGAMLPLPCLNAMVDDKARRKQPLRFVALFKPNGVHPPSWNIEGGTESDFRLSAMMTPFADHRSDLLFVDNMGASGLTGHGAAPQRFLSGANGRGKQSSCASIDQLIADKVSPGTRCRSLELTTEGIFTQAPTCSYISYSQQGNPIPRESDPQLVFDRLFRDPLVNPANRRDTASLLDRVGDHTKKLSRAVGKEDRQTLDQYLTAVRETERKIGELNKGVIGFADSEALQRPGVAKNLNEQVDLLLDVVALALWTDSTRVASLMLGNDNSRMIFDFLGVKKEHHYLSHYFRNFSRQNLDDLYKVCRWHMEKFAGLVKRLKSYTDGDSRLLDHTLVLFGAGMGESDAHTAQRIPTVLAGASGHLKTGRYVRHDKFLELAHLHRSLLKIFGVEAPRDHALAAHDPLSGLDGAQYKFYREPAFQPLVEVNEKKVTVQGLLRFSTDPERANEFFLEGTGEPQPVRLQVSFKTMEQHALPFYCGTPVRVVGTGARQGKELVVTSVSQFTSLGVTPSTSRAPKS